VTACDNELRMASSVVREKGIIIGKLPTGRKNCITDVAD
jgi:hypothetical protein